MVCGLWVVVSGCDLERSCLIIIYRGFIGGILGYWKRKWKLLRAHIYIYKGIFYKGYTGIMENKWKVPSGASMGYIVYQPCSLL